MYIRKKIEWNKGKAEDEKDRDGGDEDDEGQLCTFTDQQNQRYRCHTKKEMRPYRIITKCSNVWLSL